MFSRQFGATGQLRTVFWTSSRLLTKDAKFKQIDSDADCFKANFEEQESCAECFAQCSAFLEKSPISRTTTVSQSLLTPISSNRIVAHGVCNNFKLVNERRRVQSNRQLRRVFWRQFRATGQLRTVLWTSFSLLTKLAILKQNDSWQRHETRNRHFAGIWRLLLRKVFWRQFESTRELRTVFWTSFSVLTKDAKLKEIDSCAECFNANFKPQDCCARSLRQVLAYLQKSPNSIKTTVAQGVLKRILSNRTVAHGLLDKF